MVQQKISLLNLNKTMDIQKVRQSFGKVADKYTDEELLSIENKMRVLANVLIDRVLEMKPEERQEIEKKIKNKHYEKEYNQ